MKRILNLLLIITLVFCSCICAEATENRPHLYGADIEATKGDTVQFPVKIENNRGIAAIRFGFECENPDITAVTKADGKSLEFQKSKMLLAGNAFGAVSETGGQIVWFNVKNFNQDGELFIISFKVSESAVNGTYKVKLDYFQADTVDHKENPVKLDVTAGTITVKDKKQTGELTPPATLPGNIEKDKTESKTEDKDQVDDNKVTAESVKAVKIKLKSKLVKVKRKSGIRLEWKNDKDINFDGYEIRRSLKKNSGYNKKYFVKAEVRKYTNSKSLKKGKKYYYRIRGYKVIDGKKVYTAWSNKVCRTFK